MSKWADRPEPSFRSIRLEVDQRQLVLTLRILTTFHSVELRFENVQGHQLARTQVDHHLLVPQVGWRNSVIGRLAYGLLYDMGQLGFHKVLIDELVHQLVGYRGA